MTSIPLEDLLRITEVLKGLTYSPAPVRGRHELRCSLASGEDVLDHADATCIRRYIRMAELPLDTEPMKRRASGCSRAHCSHECNCA